MRQTLWSVGIRAKSEQLRSEAEAYLALAPSAGDASRRHIRALKKLKNMEPTIEQLWNELHAKYTLYGPYNEAVRSQRPDAGKRETTEAILKNLGKTKSALWRAHKILTAPSHHAPNYNSKTMRKLRGKMVKMHRALKDALASAGKGASDPSIPPPE